MPHDKKKQSTGSYSGAKKDRHENLQKQNKEKKKNDNWTHLGKNTNHGNNKNQGNNKKKGFCYITTAVCQTLGLPDDCKELETIRSFRDKWLTFQPNGLSIIENYYDVAPEIVNSINQQPESTKIYESIWSVYLQPFYEQIKNDNNDLALGIYLDMVADLKSLHFNKN